MSSGGHLGAFGSLKRVAEGLYRGETTTAQLTAIPFSSLDKAYSYYIDGKEYFWDADATSGAFEPDDKPNAGVDAGYWVEQGGGGVNPLTVVQLDSASITSYTVDCADSPLFIEADTSTAQIDITLPDIIGNDCVVYVKNVGVNDVILHSHNSDTVANSTTFSVLEGEYYHFNSDLPTNNWFDVMRERNSDAIQDYFIGMYDERSTGKLYLDIINISSQQTIVLSKYDMFYVISDGRGQVAHTVSGSPIINFNAPISGIEITL